MEHQDDRAATARAYERYADHEPRWGAEHDDYRSACEAFVAWSEDRGFLTPAASRSCSGWTDDNEHFLLRNNSDLLCVLRQRGDGFEVV